MGLDKVIEKIQKEAEEKITSILQDAEKQAAQMLQVTQKNIEDFSEKKRQELQKQIESLKIQEHSSVEIEQKKIRLNAEKDILQQTYQECLNALQTLSHEKIIASLLKTMKNEMPEAAVIYSNKRDESSVRSQTKLTYAGNIDCLGGIVVENAEKNMKLDYRYETIAATVWDRCLKQTAEKLFR